PSFGVFRLMRQRVRLRERHELQVAIRLPQVLDVPDDPRVAIVELLAEGEGRLDAGPGIAVPPRRMADRRILEREHVEPSGENAIGRGDVRRRIDARVGADPGPWRA